MVYEYPSMTCKPLKFFCIPILLFFLYSYSFAQKNNEAATDSSAVFDEENSANDYQNVADTLIIRTAFDSSNDSIEKWKQGREFGYMTYLDSLLRKKADLRIDTVNIDKGTINKGRTTVNSTAGANSNSFLNSFPVKFFFWTIAIFFIGFILYKLFFTGGLFAKRNAKADDEPANKEPEILDDYSAYNVLIHEAELKNDFNLSIRYLYLQSLKKLADNELINFSPDKTNNLYVQELHGRSYQEAFALLTLNYEYVWYGRFTMDINRYRKLKGQFILFSKKI
jgi:hypothetical protein